MKFFFTILLSLPVALALSADELVTSWRGVAGEASAPPAIIESKTPQGKTAFRAKPVVNGTYQGMACDVKQVFDPKKYGLSAMKKVETLVMEKIKICGCADKY